MKASDLFLRCLETEGVDTIYGVPGEENADLMMSLKSSSIKFILCRHEQAAAFMADMHGRITGKPGVCLATLGPGATNLVTGVASANMDHSPLIAIIGQASTKRLHKESHQNMDALRMFEPISKWSSTIRSADIIPEVIHKAFKLATTEKPGAVIIELPEDIAKQGSNKYPITHKILQDRVGVDQQLIQKARTLISESEFPVILAGAGVIRANAGEEMATFVTKTGIYGANTFMGKGAIPADSDRCLFCVGLGTRDIVVDAFEHADLVITVGYDMVEWHPDRWNTRKPKKIIHIDTRPAEVDYKYIADIEIVGDIKEALLSLDRLLQVRKCDLSDTYNEHLSGLRGKMVDELNAHIHDTDYPLKPQKVLADLRHIMAPDDILISDVGAHKMWVARHYPTYQPKSCFITNGFCSMGFALPAAIAAKRLNPDKNVVALCGDGGFMMNIQDLITAVRYKTPIVILLWVDNEYGLIKWKQQLNFKDYSHVDLLNPNFIALAEAFGCNGIEVNSTEGLIPALKGAFDVTDKPTLVLIPIDYEENLKLTWHLGEIICH